MQLRDYQADALAALWHHAPNFKRPLIVAPTGSGKTVIAAAIVDEWHRADPGARFVVVTHTKELVEQDANTIAAMIGEANVGVCCAGLGRKEPERPVVVGTVQTMMGLVRQLGQRQVVIVDEAHRIPTKDSMYRRFLKSVEGMQWTVGLTATPYRTGHGHLTQGKEAYFDKVVYSITIERLLAAGHLAPLRVPNQPVTFDTTAARIVAGEYVFDEDFEEVLTQRETLERIIDNWRGRAAGRKATLVFCSSVRQANLVGEMMDAPVLTGDMPEKERDELIARFKAGEVPVLVNVLVLTTGFDAPNVDCLLVLRPTMSPGLWVQMAGRGMRTCPGKTDCLVLDHGQNTLRHGPVNAIRVPSYGETLKRAGAGPPAAVECADCGELNAPAALDCVACGAEMPKRMPNALHAPEEIIRLDSGEVIHMGDGVATSTFRRHKSRSGNVCIAIDHHLRAREFAVTEYIPVDCTSPGARRFGEAQWERRFKTTLPTSVDAALSVLGTLQDEKWPAAIDWREDQRGIHVLKWTTREEDHALQVPF